MIHLKFLYIGREKRAYFTRMYSIPIVRMIEICRALKDVVIRVGIRRSNGGRRRRDDPFISGRNLLVKWIRPKVRFGFTEIKIEKGRRKEYLVVAAADIIRHDGSFPCEKSTHLVNEHLGAINGSIKKKALGFGIGDFVD